MERTPSMSELNEIMYGQVKNSYYVINFVCTYTFEFVSLFFANQFGGTVVLHACTNLTAVSLTHLDSNWLYESNLLFVQFLCDIDIDNYTWPVKVVLVSRQHDSLHCSSPSAVLKVRDIDKSAALLISVA